MLTKNIFIFYCFIVLVVVFSVYLDSYFELNDILIAGVYLLLIVFINNNKKYCYRSINFEYKQIFFSLLLILSLYVINDIFIRIFILEYRYFNTYQLIIDNLSLLFILKAIIFFPVVEEILFRKIFLHHLLKKYSYIPAILISAIGFSLAHLSSENALHYTFIMGMLLGYIYYKFKNVVLCILLHVFNNILNILLPSISLILFENDLKMVLVILLIFTLVIMLVSLKKIIKM